MGRFRGWLGTGLVAALAVAPGARAELPPRTLVVTVTAQIPQAHLESTLTADPVVPAATEPVHLRLALPAVAARATLHPESAQLNGQPAAPLSATPVTGADGSVVLDLTYPPALLLSRLGTGPGGHPLTVELTVGAGHRLTATGVVTVATGP